MTRFRFAAAVCTVLAVATATPGQVTASSMGPATPSAAADMTAGGFDPADRAAALRHWTPQRMRAVGADSTERPERIAARWPAEPPRGVGRLFLTQRAEGTRPVDSWCTATVVGGPTGARNLAVTAAHCVWPGWTRDDKRIRATDVVFVPGYANGSAPHGVWPARAFVLPTSYTEHGSPDLAVLAFGRSGGRELAEAAGVQRISFDTRRLARGALFGYPGSRGNRGARLAWCDLPVREVSGPSWQADCDLAGGASGGPWFARFDRASGTGIVVSVTSRGTAAVDEHGEVYTRDLSGPRLDDVARTVFQTARRY